MSRDLSVPSLATTTVSPAVTVGDAETEATTTVSPAVTVERGDGADCHVGCTLHRAFGDRPNGTARRVGRGIARELKAARFVGEDAARGADQNIAVQIDGRRRIRHAVAGRKSDRQRRDGAGVVVDEAARRAVAHIMAEIAPRRDRDRGRATRSAIITACQSDGEAQHQPRTHSTGLVTGVGETQSRPDWRRRASRRARNAAPLSVSKRPSSYRMMSKSPNRSANSPRSSRNAGLRGWPSCC